MPRIDFDRQDGKLEAFRTMVTIRAFEDRVAERFADNEIPGFVHLSQGQEAVAVGACGALEPADRITSTHRAHGHAIAIGLEPGPLMAEIYGKAEGVCNGRGGSMHVEDREAGMLGAQPIVGESVPLAVGAGITAQQDGADWIALAFTGDGAVAAGQVHEAFNLAAVWALPVVFVIENNRYSEGMTYDEQHNVDDLAEMAAAYGMPGETVDGQDVRAVAETVGEARERAVGGDGPTLVEAQTYRYRGHFEGDEEPYRSQREVERWKAERDPIERYREALEASGDLTEEDVEAIRTEVEASIDEAVRMARAAEQPPAAEAYEGVFAEQVPEIPAYRRQRDADGDPARRGDRGA